MPKNEGGSNTFKNAPPKPSPLKSYSYSSHPKSQIRFAVNWITSGSYIWFYSLKIVNRDGVHTSIAGLLPRKVRIYRIYRIPDPSQVPLLFYPMGKARLAITIIIITTLSVTRGLRCEKQRWRRFCTIYLMAYLPPDCSLHKTTNQRLEHLQTARDEKFISSSHLHAGPDVASPKISLRNLVDQPYH